jgi:Uma2 family endonuclease
MNLNPEDPDMAQRLSRDEFRQWAATRKNRFERVAGEPVAMSPERFQHARIKSRVWAALDHAIRGAGVACEALPDGITIEVDADTDYEPDAIVNCGPPAPGDAVAATNPVVVVEALSPGTRSVDLADKLADYFRVASIQHYLIVRATRREVIHHRRVGADILTQVIDLGAIALDPPGIAVNVADFYPIEP